MQPGSGRSPVALDGRRRDSQDLGGVFNRESGKETELDDAALLSIQGRKPLQCSIECDHVDIRLLCKFVGLIQRQLAGAAPTLGGGVAA